MLRTHARTLLRSTAAYSLPAFVGPLFTIILTPIYTRILLQDDFGVLALVRTLGMILSVVGTLGLSTALGALLHDQPNEQLQDRLISAAIWLGGSCSALLALGAIAGAAPLAQFWLGDTRLAPATALYLANLPFGAIYALHLAALRLRNELWRTNILGVMHVLLLAIFNLLFVVWLRVGVLGALGAEMLTLVCLSVLAIVLRPRYILAAPMALLHGWKLSPAARALLLAGLPLVPSGLAVWALASIDRPLLLQMGVSRDQIGIYEVANKLATMLTLVSIPFQTAWMPFALSIRQSPNALRVYARTLTYYVAGMLGMALGLSLFAHEALLLFGSYRYLDAQGYIWLLAYTAPIQGSYGIIITGLYLARKTPHMAWTAALGAAINIALNLALVPWLGVLGAAIATPLGYLCGPVAAYVVAQRAYPAPYELGRIMAALAAQAVLLTLGLPFSAETSPSTLALRGLLLLAYPVALLAFGVIARAEFMLAWGWVRRRIGSR